MAAVGESRRSRPSPSAGGDSYDAIGFAGDGALTDGDAARAILMLADATGHGVGPAVSVSQLRAMLRMAVRLGSGLAEVDARRPLHDDRTALIVKRQS